jgi:hypothetical protein
LADSFQEILRLERFLNEPPDPRSQHLCLEIQTIGIRTISVAKNGRYHSLSDFFSILLCPAIDARLGKVKNRCP